MKTKISPVLLCLLSVFALVLVCFLVMPNGTEATDPHAGHNHATPSTGNNHATPSASDSHAGHNHADTAHNKAAKDSCEIVKRENGTYTFRVISRAGHTYTAPSLYMEEPTVTAISQDIVKLSGQYGKHNLSGWAVYYNVVGEGVATRQFEYVLASTDSKVAYLHGDNGKFQVVVCNPFREEQATRTPLPDLPITETSKPRLNYKVMNDGHLQVSYTDANGNPQSVSIPLK